MGFDKALCQKEIESIKCEVAKFDLLEQVLNFKSGKGMSAQPLVEALSVHVPHKENIIDFFSQHSTSSGQNIEVAMPLISVRNNNNAFSHQ
jgi:shikimate 5-dehydrogenase